MVGTPGGLTMPERELKRKPTADRRADEQIDDLPQSTESGTRIKAELDDLLDEIDDVLETNAEDFVKSYVQKGGE
jgi:ubiquitin-like protein Pup